MAFRIWAQFFVIDFRRQPNVAVTVHFDQVSRRQLLDGKSSKNFGIFEKFVVQV